MIDRLHVVTTTTAAMIGVVVATTTTAMIDVATSRSRRTAAMSATYLPHWRRATPVTPFNKPRG
jgi:hypothetical protein